MMSYAISQRIRRDRVNRKIVEYIHKKYPNGYSYKDLTNDKYLKQYLETNKKE